ncbi:hypothetical protein P168DRAFT_113300 [Aspergillus campestris IBT 28561]|uniref:Uncharacterized protein n=1 Tax=Aspergillus campestris (strain IBT 28561) TaxID=1392248 RepID=A0A2I1D9F9_ASPC2|nr:uncharacterized protein P168DRAFT_113300 [Aspergillus campestris IBT 28561]PKY06513.1 hypothetical protein P168DRAFT_113300 [Aspergillus campestris IBT 28561]
MKSRTGRVGQLVYEKRVKEEKKLTGRKKKARDTRGCKDAIVPNFAALFILVIAIDDFFLPHHFFLPFHFFRHLSNGYCLTPST